MCYTVAMIILSHICDIESFNQALVDEWISRRDHPTLPLSIYTYTRKAQYEGHWDEITTLCRGLVIEQGTEAVIARPFPKFFNVGQHGTNDLAPLPLEPFRVYEKLDGSLAIIFNYGDEWLAASKGSFISDQAQWAQKRLNSSDVSNLIPGITYCAEIIYPSNRIVVNYGMREDLVLLAGFCADGTEFPFHDLKEKAWNPLIGSVVKEYPASPLDVLLSEMETSEVQGIESEGFVLRFLSGVRAKVKYSDYIRLHRIMTGLTQRDVWRCIGFDLLRPDLSDKALASALKCSEAEIQNLSALPNGAFASLIEGTPDEWDQWVKDIQSVMMADLERIKEEIRTAFFSTLHSSDGPLSKAEFAKALIASNYDRLITSGCFAVWDNKSVDALIWKSLYPEASKPFKEDEGG